MMLWFYRLATPSGFYRFVEKSFIFWLSAWILTLLIGLWGALVLAPADYQQGEGYRIIFIHVPVAWMSLFVYTLMTVVATVGVIWKLKLAGIFVYCAAPLGAFFTLITLLTGSIWGKPMWGTWWAWDARLTSELVLLFIYLAFIALQHSFQDQRTLNQINVIFLLVGFVNIPIIHYSVEWWNTLHQPASLLKFDRPSIHPQMLKPLLLMIVSFMLFFVVAVLRSMQTQILRRFGKSTHA